MVKNYLTTFLWSCLGGSIFYLVHMPLPWTLGPLAAVVVLKVGFHKTVRWPVGIRNNAMIVLGYVMGSPFTPQTGYQILHQLPLMVFMTLVSVGLCLSGGYVIYRFTDIGLATSLLGSLPGGLSQMAIACEEIEGTDPAAVTLMQTLRVLAVVFIVPFLVLHGLVDKVDPVSKTMAQFNLTELPVLALFAVIVIGAVFLAKRIKMSNPYLLAPVVATAVLVLSGIHAPALPPAVISIAQICVGIRMGMAINVQSLAEQKKAFVASFISVVLVIGAILSIDYVISRYGAIGFVTAFISTAPGGITEMGLTAMMVHADLSAVVAFQICRLMFVLMVALPLIKWWLCRFNGVTSYCSNYTDSSK